MSAVAEAYFSKQPRRAACAEFSVFADGRVPEFRARTVKALDEFAFDDDTAADARAQCDQHHRREPAARAPLAFAQRRRVRVVERERGLLRQFHKFRGNGHVFPAEVAVGKHRTRRAVHDARRTDAERAHLRKRNMRLFGKDLREIAHIFGDRPISALRTGRDLTLCVNFSARVQYARLDKGTAQIDTDDCLFHVLPYTILAEMSSAQLLYMSPFVRS